MSERKNDDSTRRKFRRLPGGEAREVLPFRVGEGLLHEVTAFAGRHDVTFGVAVRHCISVALDLDPWPAYVPTDGDEAPEVPVHVRMTPTMRSDVQRYQSAVGARDMSAAMRSLVTCGLALRVERGGIREE